MHWYEIEDDQREQYRNGLNFDVTICINNKQYNIHKKLLVNSAKYFEAYFDFYNEPDSNQQVQNIETVFDDKTIELFLDLVYRVGDISADFVVDENFSETTVQDIINLYCACKFFMFDIFDKNTLRNMINRRLKNDERLYFDYSYITSQSNQSGPKFGNQTLQLVKQEYKPCNYIADENSTAIAIKQIEDYIDNTFGLQIKIEKLRIEYSPITEGNLRFYCAHINNLEICWDHRIDTFLVMCAIDQKI